VPLEVDDGVVFNPGPYKQKELPDRPNTKGMRVLVDCYLEQARHKLQLDIGFGDAIVPGPTRMDFPTLLDSPSPVIWVYSLESAIAEKFEAMVRFSYANSRPKDFFDVYTLSWRHDFDGRILQEAITEIFGRRGTPMERDISVFKNEFGRDPTCKNNGKHSCSACRFQTTPNQALISSWPVYLAS